MELWVRVRVPQVFPSTLTPRQQHAIHQDAPEKELCSERRSSGLAVWWRHRRALPSYREPSMSTYACQLTHVNLRMSTYGRRSSLRRAPFEKHRDLNPSPNPYTSTRNPKTTQHDAHITHQRWPSGPRGLAAASRRSRSALSPSPWQPEPYTLNAHATKQQKATPV
jgi:hypothetical protein